MFSVCVIGTGNVAYHFSKIILENKNLKLSQVVGRKKELDFDFKLNINYINDLNSLVDADLYLICVIDSTIKEISKKIKYKSNSVIAHCSGSTNINVLKNHKNYGVIYPVQTLTKKKKIDFYKTPLLIESNNRNSFKKIKFFSKSISNQVIKCNSDERAYVHVSAVFCNNFVNYMNFISQKILESKKLDPKIILPLVSETANKLVQLRPIEAQTGPAIRKDMVTIKKHLHLLENSDFFDLYKILTNSILKNTDELQE